MARLVEEQSLPFWFDSGEGASGAQLNQTEMYVGRRLPTALRELLQERNGGVSNYEGFESGELSLPVLPFMSADPDPSAAGTIRRAYDLASDFGVPDGVVVFAAQGNAWWGLDYRFEDGSPSVVYCRAPGEEIIYAAATFEAFLDGMVEEWI